MNNIQELINEYKNTDQAKLFAPEGYPLSYTQWLEQKLLDSRRDKRICEICFTSSWEPVPKEEKEAIKDPDTSGYMRCGFCWLQSQLEQLEKELETAVKHAEKRSADFFAANKQLDQYREAVGKEIAEYEALRVVISERIRKEQDPTEIAKLRVVEGFISRLRSLTENNKELEEKK